jgi:hypothetical protein
MVLEVRSRSSYGNDWTQIPGSVRVLPDQVVDWATAEPPERLVVAYCA